MTSHRPRPPAERRRRRNKTDLQRLMEKVAIDTETGCWNWTACITPAGYGQFWFEYRRNNFAHRAAYILLVGPIPEGLVLDHLCRNRACCNPAHLEPVTQARNVNRGLAPTIVNRDLGICRNGHTVTPQNRYFRPNDGHVECADCRREAGRRQVERRRQSSPTMARRRDVELKISDSLGVAPDLSPAQRARGIATRVSLNHGRIFTYLKKIRKGP